MGGYVDTGFVHARIYGQYGRLLKRKDYEILANRQTPGEGTGGFVFTSPEEITHAAGERIFRYEVDRLLSIMRLNREYQKITAAMLGIFEVENLKNAAGRCSRGLTSESVWYDTGPSTHFSRTDIEEADSLEKLHRYILESEWRDLWTEASPENFLQWEESLQFLQLEIIRKNWGKYFVMRRRPAGRDLAALFGISLSMKKIIRQFLSGKWEDADGEVSRDYTNKSVRQWHLLVREWSSELLYNLKPSKNRDYYFDDDGLVEAEKSFHYYAWTSAREKLFSDFHSPVTAVSYLLLWYYQVKNLFACAEGIRLGRKASKIMDLVICGE